MDDIALKQAIDLASGFGVPGIILIIWYFSEKSHENTLKAYREDVQRVLLQYHDEMVEQRRMYENNVELVKDCLGVAHNLKDVIILNTQTMTGVKDDINKNQFCPMIRLRKDAVGVQA